MYARSARGVWNVAGSLWMRAPARSSVIWSCGDVGSINGGARHYWSFERVKRFTNAWGKCAGGSDRRENESVERWSQGLCTVAMSRKEDVSEETESKRGTHTASMVDLNDEDVKNIVQHSSVVRIRAHLDHLEAASISLEQFISLCGEHGLDLSQAKTTLRALHDAGVVLYLPEALSQDLRDRVILEPEKLLPVIGSVFPPSIELQMRSDLEQLQERLSSATSELSSLESRASRRATRVLSLGLVAVMIQTGVYAWLTWFETSWEVMEPICYFTTQGIMISTYIYFLYHRSEHSYRHMWKRSRDKYMRNVLRRQNSDLSWADVQHLRTAVENKQRLLAGVRQSRE